MSIPELLAMLTQFGTYAIIGGIIGPISLGCFWENAGRTGAIESVIMGAGCFMTFTSTGIVSHILQALLFSSIVGFAAMIDESTLVNFTAEQGKVTCLDQQAT